MSEESGSPTVSVERPQDFHVKKSDKIPSPMNPISSLLAKRKQRVSGVEMFKTLQKKAADVGTTEDVRIHRLTKQLVNDAMQRYPQYFAQRGITDTQAYADELRHDPEKLGGFLSSYGQTRGVPALQELGNAIYDSSAPRNQAMDRADRYAGGGAFIDLAGNVADALIPGPVGTAFNWGGNVLNPAVQGFGLAGRTNVNRDSLNAFLDAVDDSIVYVNARDNLASGVQAGAPPADITLAQQRMEAARQKALQSGSRVLKPEYRSGSALEPAVAALGLTADASSAVLGPATAGMSQLGPQVITDVSRAVGYGPPSGATPRENEYYQLTGRDPAENLGGAQAYSYGRGGVNTALLTRGAQAVAQNPVVQRVLPAAAKAAVTRASATLAATAPAAAARLTGLGAATVYAGIQGGVNAYRGTTDEGQQRISDQQVQNAKARAGGESQAWQTVRDVGGGLIPTMFGVQEPEAFHAGLADTITAATGYGQNPEAVAAGEAVTRELKNRTLKEQLYPQIAASFAGTPVDPKVIDGIAEEAAMRMQNGLDPLATSNPHSEQYKRHHAGNLDSRAIAAEIQSALAAKTINHAQAASLTAMAQLAPQATWGLLGDPQNAEIVKAVTPVRLPGLQEIDPASGKPRAVSTQTTASWDQTSKKWVDDQTGETRSETTDWSPSEMVKRQDIADAKPTGVHQLTQARDKARVEGDAAQRDAADTAKVTAQGNEWAARHGAIANIYNRYADEKPTFDAAHDAYLRSKGIDPATSMANLYKGPVPAVGHEISTAAVRPVTERFGVQLTGLPQDPNRPYGRPPNPGGFTYADPNMKHTPPGSPTHADWLAQHPVEAKRIAATPKPAAPIVAKPIGTPKIGSAFVRTATAQGLAWWTA